MAIKIYLVGNSLLPEDSMPLRLQPILERACSALAFVPFDPTEDFPENPRPIFIDTAINLAAPRLFASVNEFEPFMSSGLSVHNFDFYTELALREKFARGDRYAIIGVPPNGDINDIAQNVVRLLASLV